MGDLFNSKRVKTRKPHHCEYCREEIPAGTSDILYEWGIYDNSAFQRWTCSKCEPYVSRFWLTYDPLDEGICDYDIPDLWIEFMDAVKGEPYEPKSVFSRDGHLVFRKCGCCGAILDKSDKRHCKRCGAEIKVVEDER